MKKSVSTFIPEVCEHSSPLDSAYNFNYLKELINSNDCLRQYLKGKIPYREFKMSNLIQAFCQLINGYAYLDQCNESDAFRDLFNESDYYSPWMVRLITSSDCTITRGRCNQFYGLMRFYYNSNNSSNLINRFSSAIDAFIFKNTIN